MVRTRPRVNPRRRLRNMRAAHASVACRQYLGAITRVFLVVACFLSASTPAIAQSVQVLGPPGNPIRNVTPVFTVRAIDFTTSPFVMMLQVSTSSDFTGSMIVDTTVISTTAVRDIQTNRILPSDATIYWRAIVSTSDGKSATSPVAGPRQVAPWITLIAPSPTTGGILDTRRPVFVWRSPAIAPSVGQWRFDFELTSSNRTIVELRATLLNDTAFIPPSDLQANTSYQWSVRATAPNGESVLEESSASFVIIDPALPTTTIMYQNFPNPFPTPAAFSTCFWFDVGEPGARISLEVLDLRGNLVRTIIPGDDRIADFLPGRYGRGLPGLGNNCDNRFVWNGTANDGRPVAAGAYLLRFVANNEKPIFKTIVFKGR